MGKDIMAWEKEMEIAAAAAVSEEATGGGMRFYGTQSGALSLDGSRVPGNKMDVIILDSIYENTFYKGRFDPDNPSPPVCFALGRGGTELAPHENCEEPQSDICEECPMNEFGSSDTGRGKACKNSRRLAVIDEDMGEIRYLKIPVTSVKNWSGYVKALAASKRRPPFGVITEISLVPDSKTQFKMEFKFVEEAGADLIQAVMEKREMAAEIIMTPYSPHNDEEKEPVRLKGAEKRRVVEEEKPRRVRRVVEEPVEEEKPRRVRRVVE